MAKKRIKDWAKTATSADIKDDNYIPIDGSEGSKKLPSSLLKSVLYVDYGTTEIFSKVKAEYDKGNAVICRYSGFDYLLSSVDGNYCTFTTMSQNYQDKVFFKKVVLSRTNVWTNSSAEVAKNSILSAVATSGSYEDLSDKPTIPTKTSDITNDSGFCNVVTATSEEALPTERDENTFYAVVEE